MAADEGTDPLVGRDVGPYRVEAVLGEGHMGVVYRAVRRADGEPVALKLLREELAADEVLRRRFEREGEIASRLADRHIVPVVDRGRAEGLYYLASK